MISKAVCIRIASTCGKVLTFSQLQNGCRCILTHLQQTTFENIMTKGEKQAISPFATKFSTFFSSYTYKNSDFRCFWAWHFKSLFLICKCGKVLMHTLSNSTVSDKGHCVKFQIKKFVQGLKGKLKLWKGFDAAAAKYFWKHCSSK